MSGLFGLGLLLGAIVMLVVVALAFGRAIDEAAERARKWATRRYGG